MRQAIINNWKRAAPGVLLFMLMFTVGCSSPPPVHEGGFHSPNPGTKLYAIRQAGDDRDHSAIPHLVERLVDDDPAVRLFAIEALERITNERFDYNPYASADARRPSVDRWVKAVRDGRFSTTE